MGNKEKILHFGILRNTVIEIYTEKEISEEMAEEFIGASIKFQFAPVNSWFLIVDHGSWIPSQTFPT